MSEVVAPSNDPRPDATIGAAQQPHILRTDVPQAPELDRVIALVRHIHAGGDRRGAPTQFGRRDVAYYSQAARILGLLDSANAVTETATQLLVLRGEARRRKLAELFAGSACGTAWLRWSNVDSLNKINAATAPDFLRECSNLALNTYKHRAGTLRRWMHYLCTEGVELKQKKGDRTRKGGRAPEIPALQCTLGDAMLAPPAAAPPGFAWPNGASFPHNEARPNVGDLVDADLDRSDDVLIITGYASLDRLIPFLAKRTHRKEPQRIRLLFGNEPFPPQRKHLPIERPTLAEEMRDHWLEHGVSVLLSAHILVMRRIVEDRTVEVRIRSSGRPLHAKIYVTESAITLGSSNFSDAGFGGQSEGNARFEQSEGTRFNDSRALAEGLWSTGKDFHEGFLDLLDCLLKPVTWQEALARACAAILEGDSARDYVPAQGVAALDPPLWPHQRQGLAQALWILENMGSVVIADAAGSGKTRMGAWLVRALHDRQTRTAPGRPLNPVIFAPPAIVTNWNKYLLEARLPLRVESHGLLSNQRAAAHGVAIERIRTAPCVIVDEAHSYLNRSKRTNRLLMHYADHVVLFTATPINRDATDLIALIELLGADNLSDEALATFARLRTLFRSGARRDPSKDVERLRLEIERFMVRRTRSELNRITEAQPSGYLEPDGRRQRYPKHHAKEYSCPAADADILIAREIGALAERLTGVARVPQVIELPYLLALQNITERQYLTQSVRGWRALASHVVRDCMRSSNAALYEHIHGTEATASRWQIDDAAVAKLKKKGSGNVLATLTKKRGKPPEWRMDASRKQDAPDWLHDPTAHAMACDEDAEIYRQIGQRALDLSDAREIAKRDHLLRMLAERKLILAFDAHVISLLLFARMLRERGAPVVLFTGASGVGGKREAEQCLGRDGHAPELIALCSDALNEGLNLQGASSVVHLDTPTVIRTAEQRAGRVDRLDSRHDDVEIWWPRDPPEFAPRKGERLRERHKLVAALIGANLVLPDEPEIDVAELAKDASLERDDTDGMSDAFHSVRGLIGPDGLVSESEYDAIRTSKAQVVSCFSMVASSSSWAFVAVGGLERRAPRWVFFASPDADPVYDLSAVAGELRRRLTQGLDSIRNDDVNAGEAIEAFVRLLEDKERQLLPPRTRRALGLAARVLEHYRAAAEAEGDVERHALMVRLLGVIRPTAGEPYRDPRRVAEAWLDLLRPYRENALRIHTGRSRRPVTLDDLEQPLTEEQIGSEPLRTAFADVPVLPPARDRVIAMIVGVPSRTNRGDDGAPHDLAQAPKIAT